MMSASQDLVNDLGENEQVGGHLYHAWVGPPEFYDHIDENLLQDELQNYGGSRRCYAQYRRDELNEVRGIGANRLVDSGKGLAG